MAKYNHTLQHHLSQAVTFSKNKQLSMSVTEQKKNKKSNNKNH